MVLVAVLLPIQADLMYEPGAKMSTQVPQFENELLASVEVVDPTVMAEVSLAGEEKQASEFSLPAAATTTTPAAVAAATPAFMEVE